MASPNRISKVLDAYVSSPLTPLSFTSYNPKVVVNDASLLAKGGTTLFGVCIDNSGNIFVSDPVKHAIYKATPGGGLALYAGLAGTSGNNGSNVVTLTNARFNIPCGLACDANGNLYVADTGNHQIRKITPDGRVTLLAGTPTPTSGYVNGTAARFTSPRDLAIDASNNIYVADTGNHAIRKIKVGSDTTITIAGTNASGDVLGAGTAARFNTPMGICVDAAGVCYIADAGNFKVKKMNQDGTVTLVCGAGTRGTTVGTYATTKFQDMMTITTDRSRNLYLIDTSAQDEFGARMMKISYNGVCKTIYNFNQAPTNSGALVVGVDVDRSGKFFVVESNYADIINAYSSASSFSTASSGSSRTSASSASSDSSASS